MPDHVARFDGALEVRVRADGSLDLGFADGSFQAAGLGWTVRLADGRMLVPDPDDCTVAATGGGFRTEIKLGGGAMALAADWRVAADRLSGEVTLTNRGDHTLAIDRVILSGPGGLALHGPAGGWSFYKLGWNIASASGFVPFSGSERAFFMRVPFGWLPRSVRHMVYNEGTRFSTRAGDFHSEWLGAIAGPSGASLAFGFAGTERHFSQVTASRPDALLQLNAQMDGAALPAGASRPLEPVLFACADQPDPALQAFARAMASRHGARTLPIRLWCSWYSGFYDRVTEQGFLDNARKAREEGAPVEFFQLDDGYQDCIGNWTITNERFPSGLAGLAKQVIDLGFTPGVWTAPFALSTKCRAFREHPDWVVRDASGRPVPAGFIMGKFGPRYYYGLDTTNPEVIAWLEALYRELRGMGFRLFKIDFLTAACVPGVRMDPAATRAQAYRRGMEAVRRGAGEDAVILSGIGPVLGNTGVLDVQRLGTDTSFGHATWRNTMQRWTRDLMTPGVYNNILSSMARSFGDGILWSGDGDAMIQQDLPRNEADALGVAALLCGGSITLGHDYRKGTFDTALIEELKGRTGPARIPDRTAWPLPRQIVAEGTKDGAPVRWLALVNLEDRPIEVAPHPSALPGGAAGGAADVLGNGAVTLDPAKSLPVPAHGCRLFRIAM